MRRLLLFGFVVFFLGLVPVASAATREEPRASAPSADAGRFSLADAVKWVHQLWESASDTGLPPPGVTNGSCVDPDGTSCRSH